MIASKVGLRYMTALAGVTVSIPSTTVLFWLTLPWLIDTAAASLAATLVFTAVGLFFPAAVTLLVFQSTARIGPTAAATLSCTAPLFAVAAAVVVLGETLDLRGAGGTLAVVLGVIALSTGAARATATAPVGDGVGDVAIRKPARETSAAGMSGRPAQPGGVAMALGAAALRAAAQVLLKVGFVFWANPLAAILIGYAMSTAVILFGARLLGRRTAIVRNRRGVPWFMLAGACNGLAMLLMYAALVDGRVSVVAPVVASYPLFTLLLSALLLREERFDARRMLGVAATVVGVALLASR